MTRRYPEEIKQKARLLREQGHTYTEISQLNNLLVPKATYADWFKNISLTKEAKERIRIKILRGGARGRLLSCRTHRRQRKERLAKIYRKVEGELETIDKYTSKLCLAMLYLAEGYKGTEILRFGNSDPLVICLYLFF